MDEQQQCLILTVGLPRSGKSTWAKEQGQPVVNPDSIRLALHGQAFIPEAEGFVWETAYLMAKALFLAGHHTVIIDATNNTENRRDVWKKKFKHQEVICRYFETSKDVCIVRAEDSGRLDLIPVIERMAEEADWV